MTRVLAGGPVNASWAAEDVVQELTRRGWSDTDETNLANTTRRNLNRAVHDSRSKVISPRPGQFVYLVNSASLGIYWDDGTMDDLMEQLET